MTPDTFDWTDTLPRLDGERIVLRQLTDADVPALFAIFGDDEVVRYWSSPAMENLAAAEALLEDIRRGLRDRELFQWGIALRDSDEVIGTCTLYQLDMMHRRAELGFALRRQSWGGGFAAEAVTLVLTFAFEMLGLHRIEADADPDNARSIGMLERLGFRREGYLRERWHHLGEIRDSVFLGLLRSEFVAAPRRAQGS